MGIISRLASWVILLGSGHEPSDEWLLLSIGNALDKVKLGSPGDELQALVANRIVRRCLDKHAITYEAYKEWRRKNPLIFTAVVADNGEMIGFFDIFPLTRDAGEGIVTGTLTEHSLSIEHIVPMGETASATHIHIATILVNPKQKTFSATVAKEVLLLSMGRFIERHYAPVEQKSYTAYAQSKAGEALLRRCGFSMAVLPNQNEQNWPLYTLRPGESITAMLRFDRADGGVSAARDYQAKKTELNERIERIELQMRSVISRRLLDDPGRLPPHILSKIDERIDSAAKKHVIIRRSDFGTVETKLEYSDLRELQDIVVNKTLWPIFQADFGSKEVLAVKFDQLAELRNSIRHSRRINEITMKEGEAGILWFEQVLGMARN